MLGDTIKYMMIYMTIFYAKKLHKTKLLNLLNECILLNIMFVSYYFLLFTFIQGWLNVFASTLSKECMYTATAKRI